MKMNCPVCFSELSKKWQPPQATKVLAPRGQWSCGVCGGVFTRLEIQAAGKPVAAAPVATSTGVAVLTVLKAEAPVLSDEDEVSEALPPVWV